MQVHFLLSVLAFTVAILSFPTLPESSLSLRSNVNLDGKPPLPNPDIDLDKRIADLGIPLSNNAVYTACQGFYVKIAGLALVTGWPHLVRDDSAVSIIGQAIYDAMNHAPINPTTHVLSGTTYTGLTGGLFLFQITAGASTRDFEAIAFAPILHDAVARMYTDGSGGIIFNILDEVSRVIFKVVLMKVSN